MRDEKNSRDIAIGLYQDPESGAFIGCLDENQAAAAIRAGFKLFAEGYEAAMTPETQINSLKQSSDAADSSKKGK